MKQQKKIDLAGRLSRPFGQTQSQPAEQASGPSPACTESAARPLNYGIDRLGIRRKEDSSQVEAPAVEVVPEAQAAPQPPAGLVPRPDRAVNRLEWEALVSSHSAAHEAAEKSEPVIDPSLLCGTAPDAMVLSTPADGPTAGSPDPDAWMPPAKSKRPLVIVGFGIVVLVLGIFLFRWMFAAKVPAPAAAANTSSSVQKTVQQATGRPAVFDAHGRDFTAAVEDAARQIPNRMSAAAWDFRASLRDAGDYAWHYVTMVRPAGSQASPLPIAICPATAPAAQPEYKFRQPPPGIRVSAIINTPTGQVATINDRMVKVGGTISGCKLVVIREFSVEMEVDGERFILGISSDQSSASEEPTDEDQPAEPTPAPKAKPGKHKPAASQPADGEEEPADAADTDKAAPTPTPTPTPKVKPKRPGKMIPPPAAAQ